MSSAVASGHGRVDGRIVQPGLREALGAQPAAIAQPAMPVPRRRIVARPAQPRVEPPPRGLADDIRLAPALERGVDHEAIALAPRRGCPRRPLLERAEEFGPAIRIARIIERERENGW